MKPNDILAILKQQTPKALGKVPDERAEAIITATLLAVRHAVNNAEEGVVPIAGLGRFVVRQVPNKTDGTLNRVVLLRTLKPKAQ